MDKKIHERRTQYCFGYCSSSGICWKGTSSWAIFRPKSSVEVCPGYGLQIILRSSVGTGSWLYQIKCLGAISSTEDKEEDDKVAFIEAYLSFSIISAVKTVAENPYEIDLLTSAGQGTVDGGSEYSPTSPMSLSRVTPPWKGERGGGTCKHWARTLHDWDLSAETVPTWTFNSLE